MQNTPSFRPDVTREMAHYRVDGTTVTVEYRVTVEAKDGQSIHAGGETITMPLSEWASFADGKTTAEVKDALPAFVDQKIAEKA